MPKEDYPDQDWDVYVEGGCICAYCDFDGASSPLAWHQVIIDHVIPLRCPPSERQASPLNVRANKTVCCFACNNRKRVWDKAYRDADYPGATLPERVANARKAAREFIQSYYANLDTDYEPMMNEVRRRKNQVA